MTVRVASWSARLVRASYNYQLVNRDPGAFARSTPAVHRPEIE